MATMSAPSSARRIAGCGQVVRHRPSPKRSTVHHERQALHRVVTVDPADLGSSTPSPKQGARPGAPYCSGHGQDERLRVRRERAKCQSLMKVPVPNNLDCHLSPVTRTADEAGSHSSVNVRPGSAKWSVVSFSCRGPSGVQMVWSPHVTHRWTRSLVIDRGMRRSELCDWAWAGPTRGRTTETVTRPEPG
jgi:hypothetical protein